MAIKRVALTTIDNPYNPLNVDEFDKWYEYDTLNDYGTCELLARFALTSDSLTEEENWNSIETAIDTIIEQDSEKIYKKIKED